MVKELENQSSRIDAERRDELALQRTLLANERTVLAYFRSALAMIVTGVTFLNFFDTRLLLWFGAVLLLSGLALGIFGLWRYRVMHRSIQAVRDSTSSEGIEKPRSTSER